MVHEDVDPMVKSLHRPDRSTTFLDGSVRATVDLGSLVVGHGVYQPGWRWSRHAGPMTGQPSQRHHGYVLSGHFRIKSREGTEADVGPQEAFSAEEGHDAWVIGDAPCIALDWWPIGN